MPAIDFTALGIATAVPFPVTFGNTQNTPAGAFHIDRLGDRWGFEFTSRSYLVEPDGGRFQALFDDAEKQGGVFRVNQPGFDIGAPGLPTASADIAAGKLITIEGATPNYTIRPRQWLNYFGADGQRYLDRAMEQVVLDASGAGTIRIKNLLRAPIAEGSTIELGKPCIEGSIAMRSAPEWDARRMTRFAFTVTEDR